ncbi:formylglycine-generating enzyme family protein [Pseudomonas sp. 15FMM2]|uniref:Formylglycine-generating enzyme family protein n=1 Tax=Pseudomonas imrae TaxID=2992837 RepID=A0ACC7PDF1_9PSED
MIIEACMTCLSYDPQCEAERAQWLFSIVERAKLNAKVLQAIKAMENTPPPEEHSDSAQRSAILKELAASGSEDARRLLYSSLALFPNTTNVIGANEIIALDGLDGLIHVVRHMGQWLQADPDFWIDDYPITQYEAFTGDKGALAALEREAAVDSDIANYLAGMRKTCDSRGGPSAHVDFMTFTADEVVAYVRKNPKEQCYWLRRWGSQVEEDQRETVFVALLASKESEHVKRLLRCFGQTGVPRFDSRLLRWIDHIDAQVQWATVAALAPVKHGELRNVAKRLIADGNIANGIALLVKNFHEGDFSLFVEHLAQLDDPDETHQIVGKLLNLCEAYPGHKALDCLLYVYEFSPCSTCRKRAVKALIDTNTAPAWVLAESTFDADPETRALVRADRSFT